MARKDRKRLGLLLLGVVFHASYVLSIFDIYFRTPLVHGMAHHSALSMGSAELAVPAKRLVLMVTDGLRADKLFERPDPSEYQSQSSVGDYSYVSDSRTRAPFLSSIIRSRGSWGVSHTQVPTESRPGHVALIAGFYEDVSAVTKGWKAIPVDFDSLFNQSRHTWSFGAPDILLLFQHGTMYTDRIETFMYSSEHEDFSNDGAHLDTWVFDKVTSLFRNATANPNSLLYRQLHGDKIVFFLHLLGLDTNGHAFRPYSREYLDNIRLVDESIRRLSKLIEDFYGNDNSTAYLLTSDHGMHNRGNHGDGDPDNTRTPLIAWGAGIRGPLSASKGKSGHDAYSESWEYADLQRRDVRQADIAPLMASLIAVPFPVNNVGKLPLSYLDASPKYRAQAYFANTWQIIEQYRVKEELKRRNEPFFKPYKPLDNHAQLLDSINKLIATEKFEQALSQCDKLMDLALGGLRYYQTYDWVFLRSVVSCGYLGWMLYSLLHVMSTYASLNSPKVALFGNKPVYQTLSAAKKDNHRQKKLIVDLIALFTWLTLTALLIVKNSPPLYHVYVAFPVYFWRGICRHCLTLTLIPRTLPDVTNRSSCIDVRVGTRLMRIVGLYILCLEVLVYCFFERKTLSACFAVLALWPAVMPATFRQHNTSLLISWSISCVCTAIFPLLPIERKDQLALVNSGAILVMLGLILLYINLHRLRCGPTAGSGRLLILIQGLLITLSTVLVNNTDRSLLMRTGVPFYNQIISWIVLGMSLTLPFIIGRDKRRHYIYRLAVVLFAFAPCFILLSTSYEVIFYAVVCTTVSVWMMVERQLYTFYSYEQLHVDIFDISVYAKENAPPPTDRNLALSDARLALIFLLFINIAFFGTGNIASLSSFTLSSVYRLITVFSPFIMGTLLVCKILIPFFYISAVFTVLCRSIELPPFSLFLLVISTVDVSTLNFFWLVRDDGSWLEIGTSISHFAITSGFIVFMCLLFVICTVLVGNIIVPSGPQTIGGERSTKKRN